MSMNLYADIITRKRKKKRLSQKAKSHEEYMAMKLWFKRKGDIITFCIIVRSKG